MQEAEDERSRILWTYGVQTRNIFQLYKQGKMPLTEKRTLLLNAYYEMEQAMLIAGFEEDFGIFLNMTVAFKKGAETFVPVPLDYVPNPFEHKPLIDFGMGEFLVDQ
jgi:hypothetical protein